MSNDFLYEDEDFDLDENHEKSREREERLAQSKKARGKRQLIRDKHTRRHEEGFRGNV